jgi:hypothetical protein
MTVDDRYPEAWRPKGAPPFDEPEPEPEPKLKPLEMELTAAAMSDEEWAAFVRRTRGTR